MAENEKIEKAEKTQEYTLRVGSHTWIDGVTYNAGDKMQLTREQMERIGKERFEGQTVDATLSNDLEALREENRQLREQLFQLKGGTDDIVDPFAEISDEVDYSELLSKSVPDIAKYLQTVSDVSTLNAIQAAESKDGQPRVGVLKAIEARREELD